MSFRSGAVASVTSPIYIVYYYYLFLSCAVANVTSLTYIILLLYIISFLVVPWRVLRHADVRTPVCKLHGLAAAPLQACQQSRQPWRVGDEVELLSGGHPALVVMNHIRLGGVFGCQSRGECGRLSGIPCRVRSGADHTSAGQDALRQCPCGVPLGNKARRNEWFLMMMDGATIPTYRGWMARTRNVRIELGA